ncbi:MAG: preprotein translocase subunit YajC [Bdellovibrionales bacterium]|nr:preprotein translocase subunit YajC [Bdellovibrionales bacterium]
MIFMKTIHRPPQPTSCRKVTQIAVLLWQRCVYSFISCFFVFSAFAEEGKKALKPTAMEQFFPWILLGAFFYFILIRPQQKKSKSHSQFLTNLKRGDEVLTASGIFGSIEGITDQFVILEVAENVRIRVMKTQIASYTKSLENTEKSDTQKNQR